LGFGYSPNSAGYTIATPTAGNGFSFPLPYNCSISNLQVSADLLAVTPNLINDTGLRYIFEVWYAPFNTLNDGTDQNANTYAYLGYRCDVHFGNDNDIPARSTVISPNTYRSCTNKNATTIVSATIGTRIGIRIFLDENTVGAAAEISNLSFSASITITPT
jgi:hypothetical protein